MRFPQITRHCESLPSGGQLASLWRRDTSFLYPGTMRGQSMSTVTIRATTSPDLNSMEPRIERKGDDGLIRWEWVCSAQLK
jgi:hypothetical protein